MCELPAREHPAHGTAPWGPALNLRNIKNKPAQGYPQNRACRLAARQP